MTYGLYLTKNAKNALAELSSQIGMLSSMELALSSSDPDPAIEDSAISGYETGIKAVEKCSGALVNELGLGKNS